MILHPVVEVSYFVSDDADVVFDWFLDCFFVFL